MPTPKKRTPKTRAGRAAAGLSLASLMSTAPTTELDDDVFDPSGGATTASTARRDDDDDDDDDGASPSSSDGFGGDDDDDDDAGGRRGDDDDGVFAPTREDARAAAASGKGRLRMRGDIALTRGEYAGKSSTRRAIEEAWEGGGGEGDDDEEEEDESEEEEEEDASDASVEDEDEEEEEEEDLDGEEASDDDASEEEDVDEDDGAMALAGGYGDGGGDDEMDLDDDDDDDEEEEEDDDDNAAADDAADAAAADDDLAAELDAHRREEREANRLAATKSQNALKAQAVTHQNALWERSLRCRIVLQRAMHAAAKLPTPSYHAAITRDDEDAFASSRATSASARAALGALLRLQAALIDSNPAIAAAAETGEGEGEGKKKRKTRAASAAIDDAVVRDGSADDVWKHADAMYQRYAAFRDASCDRWHRKAAAQVGKLAGGGGGGMTAFNQSISAQVSNAMRAPDRLVERSQPPAHLAPRRYGEPREKEGAAGEKDGSAGGPGTGKENEGGVDADDEGFAVAAAAAAMREARVPELYDDADFYEQVLKEFLESAGAGGAGSGGSGLAGFAAAAKPPKRRKIVDRRASKGRKLRYHVQQKLVNFCAPVELEVPEWAEKVFARLFASNA